VLLIAYVDLVAQCFWLILGPLEIEKIEKHSQGESVTVHLPGANRLTPEILQDLHQLITERLPTNKHHIFSIVGVSITLDKVSEWVSDFDEEFRFWNQAINEYRASTRTTSYRRQDGHSSQFQQMEHHGWDSREHEMSDKFTRRLKNLPRKEIGSTLREMEIYIQNTGDVQTTIFNDDRQRRGIRDQITVALGRLQIECAEMLDLVAEFADFNRDIEGEIRRGRTTEILAAVEKGSKDDCPIKG
jgi:hypothetical protein